MIQFLFTRTPLAYFVASLWRDEAFSYLMARLPIHQLLWATAQDANPPLYYLLLKLWMGIFGTSEIALRSLSLIFFWATLYVVYLILKEVYALGTKKSLFYLLFFIINPLLHYYAFEARMYSMMAFVATLLFYALMRKKYKLYACVALIALYTHYFLLIVIVFQALFIYFTTHKRELKKHFFLPFLKTMLWYVPWLLILVFAHPPVGKSFWIAPPNWNDIFLFPAIVLTGYERDAWIVVSFLSYISLIICTTIIFGYLNCTTNLKKLNFFLLLGWAIGIPFVVFIISFIKPVFLPRYLIFASVGLTLLLITSFENITNRYIRYAIMALLVFFLLSYSSIQALMRNKAPLKKTFYSVGNEMSVNDVIYVTNELDFHVAEYYLPTKKVHIYKKKYDDLPWYIGKVLIDRQAIKETLPIYPTRAFIVNEDGSFTIQSTQ